MVLQIFQTKSKFSLTEGLDSMQYTIMAGSIVEITHNGALEVATVTNVYPKRNQIFLSNEQTSWSLRLSEFVSHLKVVKFE